MFTVDVKLSIILIGAVCLLPAAAWGLINPNFTPVHLTHQSRAILMVKTKAKQVGDRAELAIIGALKGKAPARLTIGLTKAPKQHGEAARKQFAAAFGETMLLFAGKYEERLLAYLHAQGVWLLLEAAGDGHWEFRAIDANMPATWAGGTDMLLRCVKYILAAEGDADVPVASGTAWRSVVKVAVLEGKAKGIAAVDLAGDGRLCLYVASPNGDRLYRPAKPKQGFEDVTAKVKLAAKSVASAWGDFNSDGRIDLASFDGKALTLWQQAPDGTFSPVRAGGKFIIPADCRGLTTVAVGKAATPALIVSGRAPQLLKVAGKDRFQAVTLAAPKGATAKWGKPQAALVADFTNDAIPDVLQLFEKGGLLFAGKADGGFEKGSSCAVNCTAGGGAAAVGDFDADGRLDVLAAGAEGVRVFQNLSNGRFEEALSLSGEISYKAQPFASWCGVGDFNNDSRQDVFVTYESQPLLLYFNRGFRSFGQAPRLELSLNEEITELASGQQMGVFADFDNDGAQDFVVILSDGGIWCAYNDLGGEDALCIKARLSPRSPFAGPITVTAWQKKRCLGALPVRPGSAPAFFGVQEAGPYMLKWRFPRGQWRKRDVIVEDKPVEVLLDKVSGSAARKVSPQR